MKKKLLLTLFMMLVVAGSASADTTSAPVITIEQVGNHNVYTPGNYYQEICVFEYKVTAVGEGEVHLYLNGIEVNNPCIIPQDYPDWHSDTWYENEVIYSFAASAQDQGYETGSTAQEYIVPDIPKFSLTYEDETESYWMSFLNGARYRNRSTGNEWQPFSQPFKVWQAPQNFSGGIYLEVMASQSNDPAILSSNMGILHDLSMHMGAIFRYSTYEDGIYYPYEFVYFETPETPCVTLYNYICNKYWKPSEHPACYSGEVVIPSQVEGIVDHTFENCPDLTSVFIPASVATIGEQAFVGCVGLDRIEIESLNSWCSIVFSDTLSNPLYYAEHLFLYGEEIKNLVFESESDAINSYAFAGFKGLSDVTCTSIYPPCASIDAFYNLYDQVTLFVPYESLEDYRAHEEWGRFSRIVPFIGAGPGDVNGDYELNVADATDLIDQLLNGEELPAYCDVDGDGTVNVKDITDLIDMLLNGN